MIRLSDRLWIGDSSVSWRDVKSSKIGALLNVAQDLHSEMGWPDMESMQVGLIDGPGNPLPTYYAAVLSLWSLLKRKRTLVFCHSGGRSIAVAMMYMNIEANYSWDRIISLISESADQELPVPHEAHREAFDKMNWSTLRSLTR